jgi:hypothetical protein
MIVALDRPAVTNATITRPDASRMVAACIRIGLPDRGEQRRFFAALTASTGGLPQRS